MGDGDVLDSGYSWRRLALSLALSIVGNVGMWAVILVLPSVQAEFGLDRADSTLPYTLTMAGFALGNGLIGRAVDRYGITQALIGAGILQGAGFLVAAVFPGFLAVTVLHLFIGFGAAACFAPLIADVSLWFLRRRGIAVALIASGNYLSGALWPLLLSGVIAGGGWRAAYSVLGVAVLAVVIPGAFLLRRRLPDLAVAQSDRMSLARARSSGFSPLALTVMLGLAGIGCCVAMSMPQVHIVAFCVDLGYGPAVGGQMLSLMLLGGVASRILSGLLADRIGGVRTLLIGSTLQTMALVLYLPSGGLTSLYLVSAVFGLSQGGIVPSYAVIVREYLPAREAGARVGLVIMTTIVGMALGGWMAGWIYDVSGSYFLAFVNGIAWNLLNIGIMLLILARTRRAGALAA
ncbi:probable oxalate/formate antiporter [Pseudooceanicola batsensis HTCC2597]|uniref:Probable oxalate/formate antiporter n=1 Tax=Pseudooceanicola batsensis (strain ATCC BAA-863 / DSM 15984 / KCTC 12145 / HTCC2597) TaxID=252305 RepID=A3TYM9_PSEBH|nr:MFS transporter [Pseudooceanicola batsensis]EAQ03263.1 probable oxalate/formate antiporter [Pseudooceanicola batsensis HTCC2597]